MMVRTGAFWIFLLLLGLQRLAELVYARFTAKRLLAKGARLVRDDGMGLIIVVHVAFFAACATEWAFSDWAGLGWWTVVGAALFACGEFLRYWSMATLRGRWNTRVYVVPSAPLVTGGPYHFLRHPIYLGVALELVGFPMMFGLWGTLAGIGALNLVAIRRRVTREAKALGFA